MIITEGWKFNDPVFKVLPRANVSIPILALTYGSLVLFVFTHLKKKYLLSRLALSYAVLLLLRTITLTLVPLAIPEDIVWLDDPFLNGIVYQGDIAGDLFFSGHTALLVIIYFQSNRKWWFLLLMLTLGVLLMIQRVHYSIDILGALPFGYMAVRIVDWVLKKLTKGAINV